MSLISPVCEGKEPREHARKRLMQAAYGVKQALFSDAPFSLPLSRAVGERQNAVGFGEKCRF